MKVLILTLFAVLPSVVILSIIYNKDSEKEPMKLLLSLFGVGIISCFITLILTKVFVTLFPSLESKLVLESKNYINLFLYCFLEVGLIEEFSKWIFNISIGWNSKEFDHIYDAIVYAVFISLGFATLENIIYVLLNGFNIAFIRAIISVPSHAFFGVFMGYYIGLAKLSMYNGKENLSKKYIALSLIIPSLLHGLFDFCLLSSNLLLLLLFVILLILIYIHGIKKIKQFSKISVKIKESDRKCCTNCGALIEGNYCSNCGKRVEY